MSTEDTNQLNPVTPGFEDEDLSLVAQKLEEEEAQPQEPEDKESEKPEEQQQQEEQPDEDDEDDLFAPWQDLRQQMIADGIPMEEMDARFEEGNLTEEDYKVIAEKSGNPVKAVKTHLKLLAGERGKQKEAVEQAKENYYKEMDESAGGSHVDLIAWVAQNANQDQKDLWQEQLDRKDPQVTLRVIRAMKATRDIVEGPSKSSQPNAEKEAANTGRAKLDLLTASNSSPAKAQAQVLAKQAEIEAKEKAAAEVDPLAGNPYKDYKYQALCQARLALPVEKRGPVDEVLRVRYNS